MRDSDFPREEMDLFFETAAAAFRVMKTKGLVYYDASKAVFTYGSVEKCFRYGIYYLNMGLSPDVLAACQGGGSEFETRNPLQIF